jgi:hypothetical protein
VEQIDELFGPRLAEVREVLEKEPLSRERSFSHLCELLEFFIIRILSHPDSNRWLSIFVREEICPSEAFNVFFKGLMRPLQEVLFGVVARIVGQDKDNPDVKLRVFTILGQILMFQYAPTGIRRTLNWKDYGPENLDAIRHVIMDNLKGIFAMPENSSGTGSGASDTR